MPLYSLQYVFRQPLNAPPKAAYSWCTDFEPADGKLFPVKWRRSVRRLSKDALVLTDTTYPAGRPRRIHRLVRLNPSEMAWTNTHLDGPFRHSQYLVPDCTRRPSTLPPRVPRVPPSNHPSSPFHVGGCSLDRPRTTLRCRPVASTNGPGPATGPNTNPARVQRFAVTTQLPGPADSPVP